MKKYSALIPVEMFILESFLLHDAVSVTIDKRDREHIRKSLADQLNFVNNEFNELEVSVKKNLTPTIKEIFYLTKIVALQGKLEKIREKMEDILIREF